jgi:hypothetical protein
VYVIRTTLSGNVASNGGGIDNYGYASIYVTNSTLSGNAAGQGGGIYNFGGALEITNSTLSDNSASQGGGIYNVWYEGRARGYKYFGATNSIVAHSSRQEIVSMMSMPDSATTAITSLKMVRVSPPHQHLRRSPCSPLADNWSFTPTMPCRAVSYRYGSENCLNTDQRGISRPLDGDGDGIVRCDIGAFELLITTSSMFLPLMAR